MPRRDRGRLNRIAAPLLALFTAGCATGRVATRHAAPPGAERQRLGWVTWADATTIVYCSRHVDDAANQVGTPSPCFRLEAGERPKAVGRNTSLGRPDATPVGGTPDPRCTLAFEDGRSTNAPARLWLVSPSGRRLLDEWMPDPTLTADAYTVELSYAPEGHWAAVLRLAVGLGEGERTVEVADAKFMETPACR